jgi:hypothetical protein
MRVAVEGLIVLNNEAAENETENETETENVVRGVRLARSGTLRTLAPITEWEATGSRRYKFIHE